MGDVVVRQLKAEARGPSPWGAILCLRGISGLAGVGAGGCSSSGAGGGAGGGEVGGGGVVSYRRGRKVLVREGTLVGGPLRQAALSAERPRGGLSLLDAQLRSRGHC